MDVVTFITTAKKLLHDFHNTKADDDPEKEKLRIIETAAKIIKSDVKNLNMMSLFYPSTQEIESITACLNYLPISLQTLFRDMFSGKDTSMKVASIGQAIMQQVRPRTITPPLQIGLAVQMHRQFGSRFLNDSLHSHRFCSSYTEVKKYEGSAAFHQETAINGLEEGSFLQYTADNVDHNIRTLDGLDIFHGMGIVVSVTPYISVKKVVPKCTLSAAEITNVGRIETHFFRNKKQPASQLTFEKLKEFVAVDSTKILGRLWQCSWLLKPHRSLWNGYMQSAHDEEHPGKSSVVFMPMIDMKSTDYSCILSTLHFVSNQAQKYNKTPILTFDQPLYWKALEIQLSEDDSNYIKNILLSLGGFDTCMSFLGSIGHLMTGSGLQSILELIYADHTVPHMLSGKAIARAIQGYCTV